MQSSNIKTTILKALRSTWAILFGILAGIYIGLYEHDYLDYIIPVGEIYLDILKMCIFPILLSAITVSIARLFQAEDNSHIGRMLTVFIIGIFMSAILGTVVGMIGQPGSGYDKATLSALGSIIQESNTSDLVISLVDPYVPKEKESLIKSFFNDLIPENIFSALSAGSSLKVLFFSILFGLAIGALNENTSRNLISTLDSVYLAFAKIVQWLMYFLPFGLCGLIAHDVSQVGMNVLMAMVKFIPIVLLAFLLLFILSSIVMWHCTGSLTKPIFALKDTIIMALGTGNTLACLPSSLTAMHETLGYDKRTVDLLIPLTFMVCRTGPTLYFALSTVFVAQLYKLSLDSSSIMTIILGSIFAGLATAGASGVVLLSMLGLVLSPLGLPVDAILILFIVIDPIIGPFRVLAIVHTACAIITLIIPRPHVLPNVIPVKINA